MDPKIRVAILDDHQSIIDGYRYRLEQSGAIQVVAMAAFGSELDEMLAQQPVDVVILDISVPIAPGNPNPYPILTVIPRLLTRWPELTILVISMHAERALIQALVNVGISGYILKDDRESIEGLAAIVQAAVAGGLHLSPQVQQKLYRSPTPTEHLLTTRQLEALLMAAGHPEWSRADLANHLSISNSTARNLLSGTYLRLQVKNLASAILKARQLGLLPPALDES